MSAPDLDPLPPDLLALLDAERARPVPDDAHVERALGRVLDTVRAPAGAPPTRSGVFSTRGLVVAGTLIVGVGMGAWLHATRARTPPQRVVELRRMEAPALVAPAPVVPGPVIPTLVVPAPVVPVRRPAPRAAVDAVSGTDLAAERALVEEAREALRRGDYAAADGALRRHAQRFPWGQLTEAREALRVQALVGAGQVAGARAAAANFRRRFPHSMLLPVVDAALRDAR